MSKVLRVTDGDYRIIVDNGPTGTIYLDTTSGSATPRGTVVITGDLEVKGTTTTVESTVTTIADNILTLNEGEAGAGVRASFDYKAGIEIDRGSLPTARLVFDEQSPYVAGGSSGTGSFRFEDVNGDFLPLNVNSLNAEGPLYVTTPNSAINVAGTVDYEANVFNYSGGAITDPGSGVVLNNDFVPNAKGVVDYVAYALATNLQAGISQANSSVSVSDFDVSGLESVVAITVDGAVISSFYSNRIELGDLKIQNNQLSTTNSNEDLVINAPGTGSVTVEDAFVITSSLYPDDMNNPANSSPTSGIKLYSTDEGAGDTGLYFVNKDNTSGEIISKNRALLYSMLF
jgi:hypothetical protein|tara:strand:+ start:26 stop:1057 length:1032 start_codon:yes stop_codon:yes gene_type:complete